MIGVKENLRFIVSLTKAFTLKLQRLTDVGWILILSEF